MIFKTISSIDSAPKISKKDIEETYSWLQGRFHVLKNERRLMYAEQDGVKKAVAKQPEFIELREIEDFCSQFRQKISGVKNALD